MVNSAVVTNSDEEEIDYTNFDVYEYEEGVAEEDETRKNKRFDPVQNFQYEFPQEFEDENVESDEEDVEGSDDDGRHGRMLQTITGLPIQVFRGKQKKSDTTVVVSEAYAESEYNPTRDVLDGDSHISLQDLLDPLHGRTGFSSNHRRRFSELLDRKSVSVQTPLCKPDQEMAERMATYQISNKDITKWEPIVKKNREASTLFFKGDVHLGVSTLGAIASQFQPRTFFEKKLNALLLDKMLVESHAKDGAKLLEMNKISMEDVKEARDRQAKTRSLLFRHEIKAKQMKKIKSKTYHHRLSKKDRLKSTYGETVHMDPEAAREYAKNQEFQRVKERYTLKHGNKGKWAKRNVERGLSAQDEGTRAAMAAQLHEHARLKRKMHSMKDSSSDEDDDNVDDDEEACAGSDQGKRSNFPWKEDKIVGTRGFSLPFMVRALKRSKEAKIAVGELKDDNETNLEASIVSSGRRTFGAAVKEPPKSVISTKSEIDYGSSSGEEEGGFMATKHVSIINQKSKDSLKNNDIDTNLFRERSEIDHDLLFKSFKEIAANPGPKTTHEVVILAPHVRNKIKNKGKAEQITESSIEAIRNTPANQDIKEAGEDSDSESQGQMVDGILTVTTTLDYDYPSQEELRRRAFAGDDVELDFNMDKQDFQNDENPAPVKPSQLPAWGYWSGTRSEKDMPLSKARVHDDAKKKRVEALKLRKDAHLKNVIISEKFDKMADKYYAQTLPFPYTSNVVYEGSIRMPLGPDFNPASTGPALNLPAVMKKPGLIIEPIKIEDVNPCEHAEDYKHKPGNGKHKTKKGKSNGGKTHKFISQKVKAGH